MGGFSSEWVVLVMVGRRGAGGEWRVPGDGVAGVTEVILSSRCS